MTRPKPGKFSDFQSGGMSFGIGLDGDGLCLNRFPLVVRMGAPPIAPRVPLFTYSAVSTSPPRVPPALPCAVIRFEEPAARAYVGDGSVGVHWESFIRRHAGNAAR